MGFLAELELRGSFFHHSEALEWGTAWRAAARVPMQLWSRLHAASHGTRDPCMPVHKHADHLQVCPSPPPQARAEGAAYGLDPTTAGSAGRRYQLLVRLWLPAENVGTSARMLWQLPCGSGASCHPRTRLPPWQSREDSWAHVDQVPGPFSPGFLDVGTEAWVRGPCPASLPGPWSSAARGSAGASSLPHFAPFKLLGQHRG